MKPDATGLVPLIRLVVQLIAFNFSLCFYTPFAAAAAAAALHFTFA